MSNPTNHSICLGYNDVMETLKSTLENTLMDALRAKDDLRKRTIRMALAAIKFVEKEKRISLDDNAVIAILQKEIKNRRESIQDAEKAHRPDLVAENEAEINVLEGYLPKPMAVEELIKLAQAVITETGAQSPTDMGKVMKILLPRVQGKASGDQVSQVVRNLLQSKT
jgi:uncharacterized protein